MKKEDLIKELQKLPDGTNVSIYDWRKSYCHADDEGNSEGMYDFNVQLIEPSEDSDTEDKFKPFAVLSFDNDDYNDDGQLIATLEETK